MSRWAAASWVTFVINISGSFAIGLLAMILAHWLPHPHARLLILTGFLGGYTTFSTLAYESAILWERGD
jgi:CrcB protein